MKVYDQLIEVLKTRKNEIVTTKEMRNILHETYGTNPTSVILSDFCYNRVNDGIAFNQHLFQYLTNSRYKYLGEHYPYTGLVFRKPRQSSEEFIAGEWHNGVKKLFEEQQNSNIEDSLHFLSQQQIVHLFEQYNEVLKYEQNILGCKPTELRHLVGRCGEFFCAIITGGTLARETNQHGFDVIVRKRKVSVKTTAQHESRFVAFNKNTYHLFDDVCIIQYKQDDFHVLYYGDKESIKQIARPTGNTYEVDIRKVKALYKQLHHEPISTN